MKTKQEKLDRAEWDFSQCFDGEWIACAEYEYGREAWRISPAFRERWEPTRNYPGCSVENGNKWPFSVAEWFLLWPEFPEKAFLSVPQTERKSRGQLHEKLCPGWPDVQTTFRDVMQHNAATVEAGVNRIDGDDGRGGIISTAAFNIDWTLPNETLCASFREWLIQNRPPSVTQRVMGGASSAERQAQADLKALGALRILRVVPANRARDETRKITGEKDGLFSDPPAWSKAKKRAEKRLRELIPTESP